VPQAEKVSKSLLKVEKVCQKLRKCAKSWESIKKCEKVWPTLEKVTLRKKFPPSEIIDPKFEGSKTKCTGN